MFANLKSPDIEGEVEVGASFPVLGSEVDQDLTDVSGVTILKPRFCRKCGSQIQLRDSQFCSSCGMTLADS